MTKGDVENESELSGEESATEKNVSPKLMEHGSTLKVHNDLPEDLWAEGRLTPEALPNDSNEEHGTPSNINNVPPEFLWNVSWNEKNEDISASCFPDEDTLENAWIDFGEIVENKLRGSAEVDDIDKEKEKWETVRLENETEESCYSA